MFNGRADSSRYQPRSLSTSAPANACTHAPNSSMTAGPPAPSASLNRRDPALFPPTNSRIPAPLATQLGHRSSTRDAVPSLSARTNTRLIRAPASTKAPQLTSARLQSGSTAPRNASSRPRHGVAAVRSALNPSASTHRGQDFEHDDGNQVDPQLDGDIDDTPDDAASSACSTAFASSDNHIITAVRVRPMFASERKAGHRRIIDMGVQTASTGNWTRIVNPLSMSNSPNPAERGGSTVMTSHATQFSHDFKFDFSFWSYDQSPGRAFATQSTIYEELGTFAIESAWQGYNCSIFAYGQTSAGKTFTMMGDTAEARSNVQGPLHSQESPPGSHPRQGLIPRICRGLFEKIEHTRTLTQAAGQSCRFAVQVSYVEVYHERVYDLLAGAAMTGKESLKVRENPEDGVFVENAKYRTVSRFEDIKSLIDEGNRVRSVAATNLNQRSSRSHAILTLFVKQHSPTVRISAASLTSASWMADPSKDAAERSVGLTVFAKKSKICLVDLAGSERADISGASDQRLKEAGSINRSLSTLADVISALSKRSSVLGGGATHSSVQSLSQTSTFVPYRNSVLTRLLKESLGGNAKTVMLAGISPCCVHYEETLSTLKYIERAKHVVNIVKINTENGLELVQELRREISELKARLQNTSKAPPQAFTNSAPQPLELQLRVDQTSYRCDIPDHAATFSVLLAQEERKKDPDALTMGTTKAHGPEIKGSDGSPQYATIKFTGADKAKMEHEIAKLKLQLKKKDKEILQQQQELVSLREAENQRQAVQEELLATTIRRQSLLSNIVTHHFRLVFQSKVRAFERWRVSAGISHAVPAILSSSVCEIKRTSEEDLDLLPPSNRSNRTTSSPGQIAAPDVSGRARLSAKRGFGAPRTDAVSTLDTLSMSVVDSVLFDGQIETVCHDAHRINAAYGDFDLQLCDGMKLNPLEMLATTSAEEDDDFMTLSQALEICLSPFDATDRLSSQDSVRPIAAPSILTLEFAGVNEFELDRELQDSIDAAAAMVEAFEEKHHMDVGPVIRHVKAAEHSDRVTAAIAKHKQQVQARIVRCVDVIDLARKYLGPTDRRLRLHNEREPPALKNPSAAADRTLSSTGTERHLLKYADRCFVAMCHRLEEFRTAISVWSVTSESLSNVNDFDAYLQRKVTLYERIEALLTVFCLHVVRRVCDQMCAPVTMALVNAAESINDQLTSFQSQLTQPEMWKDTMLSTGTLSTSLSVDEPVVLALVYLYGLTERIKATWPMIDQKHRLVELHLRSQHNLVETSTHTISKLRAHCKELELRLVDADQRHQEQLLCTTKIDVELSSLIRRTQDQEQHHALEMVALRQALASAKAKAAELEALSQLMREEISDQTALDGSALTPTATIKLLVATYHSHVTTREQVADVENLLQVTQKELAYASKELTLAQDRVSELETTNAELCLSSNASQLELSAQMEVELSAAKAQFEEAASRATELESKVRAAEECHASVQSELLVASLHVQDVKTQLSSMTDQWRASERDRAASNELNASLSEEKTRLGEQVSMLTVSESDLVAHKTGLADQVAKLTIELKLAQDRVSELETTNAELCLSSNASQLELSAQMEVELSAAKAQFEEAASRATELESKVRAAEECHASVQSELLVASLHVQDVKTQLSSMTDQWRASERDRAASNELNASLSEEKTRLGEQVSMLTVSESDLVAHKTGLADQVAKLTIELKLAQDRVSELETTNAELCLSSNASQLELSAQMEVELSAAKAQFEEAASRATELESKVRAAEECHASVQSELLVASLHVQDVKTQLSSMTDQWRASERDRAASNELNASLSEEKTRLGEQVSMLTVSESDLVAHKTGLADQVAKLTIELKLAQDRVSELETTNAELCLSSNASQLELSAQMEVELSAAKAQFEEAASRATELESKVRAAEECHASVQSELLVASLHVQDVKTQLSSMTDQWRASERDRAASNELNASLSEEKTRLGEQVSMLTVSESDLVAHKTGLADQVAKLTIELKLAQDRVSELETTNAELCLSSNASQLELSAQMEVELSAAKAQFEEAASRATELESKVRAAEECHASVQSELLVASLHVQDVKTQLSSMTDQWRASERDRAASNELNASLSEEKTRLGEQVSMLTVSESDLVAHKTGLADQVAKLTIELKLAQDRVSELETTNAELCLSSNASQLELSAQMEVELSAAKAQFEEAASRATELESKVRAAEECHASVQSELLVASLHVQDVKTQLSSMTDQWRASERDRAASNELNASLSEEKTRLGEQVSMLTVSESDLVAHKTGLADQVAKLTIELKLAQDRVSELETTNAELCLSSNASQLELSAQMEVELSAAKAQFEEAASRATELESKVRAAEECHASVQSELLVASLHVQDVKTQLSSMTDQWRASERDRAASNELNASLSEEKTRLGEQVSMLTVSESDLVAHKTGLADQVAKLTIELKLAQDRVSELETTNAELCLSSNASQLELSAQMEVELSAAKAQFEEAASRATELESKVRAAEECHASVQSELLVASLHVQDVKTQLSSMTDQWRASERDRAASNELNASLSEEKTRLGEQVSMLTVSESDLVAHKTGLADQVAKLTIELKLAQDRVSELETTNAELCLSSNASQLELSAQMEVELSAAKAQFEEAASRATELESKVRAAEECHASVQSELLVASLHVQDVKTQLSSMTDQWRASERDRAASNELNASLSEEKTRLGEQVSMLTVSESDLVAHKTGLADQVAKLTIELKLAQDRVSELETTNAELCLSSNASQLELSAQMEVELSAAKAQFEEAASRATELESKVRAAEECHASVQSELLVASLHVQDVKTQLSSMTDQWRASERDRAASNELNASLSEEKTRLGEQVSMLTVSESDLVAHKTGLADQVAKLTIELKLAQDRVSELETTNAELCLSSNASQLELSAQMEVELSAAKAQFEEAASRATELESKVRAAEECHASVQSELLVASLHVQDVKTQLSSMTDQWRASERDRAASNELNASLSEEKTRLGEQVSMLTVSESDLVAHKTGLADQVAKLTIELKLAQDRVSELETTNAELCLSSNASQLELSAQMEVELSAAKAQFEEAASRATELESKVRAAEECHASVQSELLVASLHVQDVKTQLSSMTDQWRASERDRAASNELNASLSEEKTRLGEQVSMLTVSESDLVAHKTGLADQVAKLTIELKLAQDRVSELETTNAELCLSSNASQLELSAQMEVELSAAKAQFEEAASRATELESKVRAAEECHASVQSELLVASLHVQDVKTQLSSMTDQWRASERDRAASNELNASLSEEKTRLGEQVSMLTVSESDLVAHKTGLADQVAKLTIELKLAQDRVSELETTNAELCLSSNASQLELSAQMEVELSAAKAQFEEAASRATELESKVRAAEECHASVQSELLVASLHVQDVKTQLSSMTDQWRASERDRAASNELNASLSEEKTRLGEQVSMLTVSESDLVAHKTGLADQVAKLTIELKLAQDRVSELETTNAELCLSSNASQLELSAQMEVELSAAKAQFEEAASRATELESKVRAAEECHASVQSELLVASLHVQDVKTQLSSMTDQWRASERDRAASNELNASLSEEKTRLGEQVSMLTVSESDLVAHKTGLADQVAKLTIELKLAQDRVSELETTNAELCLSSNASQLELSAQMEVELSAAKAQFEEAASRVMDVVAEIRVGQNTDDASLSSESMEMSECELTDGDKAKKLTARISELEEQWTFAADMQREVVARFEIVDEERRELQMTLEGTEERYSNLASEFWSQSLLLARIEDDLAKCRVSEAKAAAQLGTRDAAFATLLVERTIDVTDHNAQICCLRDEICVTRDVVTKLSSDIVEMTAKHLVEHAVAEQLERQMTAVTQQAEEWSGKYEQLAQTYVTQRAQLFQSQNELRTMQQVITSIEARAGDAESSGVGKETRDRERLEETVEDTQSRYNSLRDGRGDSDNADWEGMYNGLMSDMHVRIQELQDQLDEMTTRAIEAEGHSQCQSICRASQEAECMCTNEEIELQKTLLEKDRSFSREVEQNAVDLHEVTQMVAEARECIYTPQSTPDEVKTTIVQTNLTEQHAQKVVLKHLNSLEEWFSQAILQEDAPTSNAERHRLGSIAEDMSTSNNAPVLSDDEHEDDMEEVWPVEGIAMKLFKKTGTPLPPTVKLRQLVDATTGTDTELPLERLRANSTIPLGIADTSALPSELALLRTTILKLKATIDEKEGIIQFMDERLSYFENERFK